jgi:hypothetical protein
LVDATVEFFLENQVIGDGDGREWNLLEKAINASEKVLS